MKEKLKELVYNEGLNTLLSRMEIIFSSHDMSKLNKPVIVAAHIESEEVVLKAIEQVWHPAAFTIKNVKINLAKQTVDFEIYGHCYVPFKYSGYILLKYSLYKTEECDHYYVISEEYAQEQSLPLLDFINKGIELKIV